MDVESSAETRPPDRDAAATVCYVLDPKVSRFTVRAFAAGVLSAFGHSPTIALRDFAGEIRLNPEHPESSSLHFTLNPASLRVADDISDRDRREMEREMQETVLETAKYPEILYDCSTVVVDSPGNGNFAVKLLGNLTLHGVSRNQPVPARVVIMGDMLRAFGEFSIRQSDYNVKLVSAIGGGLKVKDELKFSFDLVARKKE